jgi:hypothetical protein
VSGAPLVICMPTDPKALVDLLMYMERHFSILPQEINGRSLAFFMLHRFVASRSTESRDRNEAPAPIAPEAEQATAGGTSPAAEAVDKGRGLRSALTTRLSPLNSTRRVFLFLLRGAASFGPHVSN